MEAGNSDDGSPAEDLPQAAAKASENVIPPLLDVVHVETRKDFTLLLEFENGERRVYDMKPWLHKKVFVPLQDPARFAQAFIDYGTVVWPGEVDICPITLYEDSVPAS